MHFPWFFPAPLVVGTAPVSSVLDEMEILLFLLAVISLLAVVATKLRFSFPVLLVLAGLVIGLAPRLPHVEIESEVVFLVILPPLLFSAAYMFPWREFKSNIRSILLLAVGLVLATTVVVATMAWWLIPGFSLAAGFVLGAIVSPPDAVAANAVLRRLGVPPRIQSVLEGESLVNDSSGLVAWQFAVAALVTGTFSLRAATGEFFLMSIGGTLVGLVGAWILSEILRRVDEVAVELTLFIMTPWILYLGAEEMGLSGVLAAVAGGILIGHRSDIIFSSRARLESGAVWNLVQHLLTSVVFILIGLQFPNVMRGLSHVTWWELAGYLAALVGVVVGMRFAWIFAVSWLLKRVFIPSALKEPPIENKHLLVMSWCGMRGVVSMAAALAIPQLTSQGEPLAERNLILFLTFGVIFVTLILPSLTLPALVKKLGAGIPFSGREDRLFLREKLSRNALKTIDQIGRERGFDPDRPLLQSLRSYYQARLDHVFSNRESPEILESTEIHAIIRELCGRQRDYLRRLALKDQITEEERHKTRAEIDADELRLSRVFGGEIHPR